MPQLLKYVLTGIGLVLLQWLVLERLRIFGAYPDVLILFIAWVGLIRGRVAGALTGFILGLTMDVLHDTWGLQMLVKTLLGFVVGLYPASERETLVIQPEQAFLGALMVALFHNGLYVAMLALQTGARNTHLVLALWLGAGLYTAILGFIAALFHNR